MQMGPLISAFATGVPAMVIGRLITGVGVGASSALVPLYLTEVLVTNVFRVFLKQALEILTTRSHSHASFLHAHYVAFSTMSGGLLGRVSACLESPTCVVTASADDSSEALLAGRSSSIIE